MKLDKSFELLLHIDATPTDDYPLRILKAYRYNCNLRWSSSSDELKENELIKNLNALQDKRAKLLDEAIRKLETP